MDQQIEKGSNKIAISKKIIFIIITVLIVAIVTSVFLYIQYRKVNQDPNEKAKIEIREVKERVSRHMILPDNEEPTLATVSDPEKLSDQAFFKKAEKGDKVLLYANSKKAILYSVTKDIILEVAPFSSSQQP